MAKSFLNIPGLPIGLRNNNPGNIRPGDNWQGMLGEAGGFVVFENVAYGIRALGIDLRTKIKNGYDTIELIIFRYAPPIENDTLEYIRRVVLTTGIEQNKELNPDPETLAKLCRGIINVELGPGYADYITQSDINEGINLMGGPSLLGPVGFSFAALLLLFAVGLFATMPPNKRAKLLNI